VGEPADVPDDSTPLVFFGFSVEDSEEVVFEEFRPADVLDDIPTPGGTPDALFRLFGDSACISWIAAIREIDLGGTADEGGEEERGFAVE
jgi:hypothetical protein